MSRYVRQETFPGIGGKGQLLLSKSAAAVVGVGAIGSVAAELLARSGVNLLLIDKDAVALDNLQRQSLFTESDVGKNKAHAAKYHLAKINSTIKVEAVSRFIDRENISLISHADIVLGCTDNLESKYILNDHCVKTKIPYIYGGAVAGRGILFNVISGRPCLRCVIKGSKGETAATTGILNTITYLIGSMMAGEVIKVLTHSAFEKDLLHIDVWQNSLVRIKVKRKKGCVCSL